MLNLLADFYRAFRRRWVYGLMATLMATGIVITTPRPSQAVPFLELLLRGIQVIQLSTLSDNQEVAIGRQINERLTSQELRLYSGRTINSYVNQIGQRLIPYSKRPNLPYTFQVVDSNQVNAFATMGGYVYVTTGLITTADNEAQLASVIGHEIGHIEARHAVQQLRENALAQGVLTAAGIDRNAAVNLGVELALRRPNSRQDELEADQLGLATLRQAGYAPGEMVAFMRKLLNQSSIPTFLSTHPAVPARIEALNRAIDPATAAVGDGLDRTAYRQQISELL